MGCGCHASFDCSCNKQPNCSSLANVSAFEFGWQQAIAVGGALALVGLVLGWAVSLEPLGLDPGWDVRVKK